MSLGRDFVLSMILGLRNVQAVFCYLFRCFELKFKENIYLHPAFIIRDINSCWKGYSKGRLKSRESNHFKVQIETLETLVMRHATTAARNVVSFSTLIGPFEFERALKFNGRSRSRSNSNGPIRVENETKLRAAVVACLITRVSGKPKRWI